MKHVVHNFSAEEDLGGLQVRSAKATWIVGVGSVLVIALGVVALLAALESWHSLRILGWVAVVGGLIMLGSGIVGRGESWASGLVPGGAGLTMFAAATLLGGQNTLLVSGSLILFGASLALGVRGMLSGVTDESSSGAGQHSR